MSDEKDCRHTMTTECFFKKQRKSLDIDLFKLFLTWICLHVNVQLTILGKRFWTLIVFKLFLTEFVLIWMFNYSYYETDFGFLCLNFRWGYLIGHQLFISRHINLISGFLSQKESTWEIAQHDLFNVKHG